MMAVRNLKNSLMALRRELGLPANLAQAGISRQKIRELSDQIVKSTVSDPCCATNPVPVTEDVVRRVLCEVTG